MEHASQVGKPDLREHNPFRGNMTMWALDTHLFTRLPNNDTLRKQTAGARRLFGAAKAVASYRTPRRVVSKSRFLWWVLVLFEIKENRVRVRRGQKVRIFPTEDELAALIASGRLTSHIPPLKITVVGLPL